MRFSGLMGILLLPIAIPVAFLAGLISKPVNRTAEEVARYLREFIDGTGGENDWDDFECAPIANPALDRIRVAAGRAGPQTRIWIC